MGVVRREGDWRLEKRESGLYEITYQRDVHMKVLTSKYTPGRYEDPMIDSIPVRKVESYGEVEGMFEEQAHGGAPSGFSLGGRDLIEPDDSSLNQGLELEQAAVEDDFENIDAPPGVIAIVLFIVGGIILSTQGWQPAEIAFQVGSLMAVGGLLILAWGGVVGKTKGWDAATELLFELEDGNSSSQGSDHDVKTTTPASQKTKNTLIFNRADQRCEWCDNRSDHLEVHHIEPRSKGGSNDPNNLIVLCPDDHRKADSGGISKTQLKGKVRRLPEVNIE